MRWVFGIIDSCVTFLDGQIFDETMAFCVISAIKPPGVDYKTSRCQRVRNLPKVTRLLSCLLFTNILPIWVAALSGNNSQSQTHKVHPIFTDGKERNYIRVGYLTGSQKLTGDHFYVKPGQSISGAITLAVKEVNDSPNILPNHTLQFVIAETNGVEKESIRQTVLLMREDISAYIGPQETCVHEARIAASFNLPMISYVSRIFICSISIFL